MPSVDDVRRQIAQATRDPAGLAVDAQPHLTRQQLYWLAYRLDLGTDGEASVEAQIDPDLVRKWKRDPVFMGIYQECMANKREGFRFLTQAALPQVFRVLLDILNSAASPRAQLSAAALLLRVQALLIDKVQTHNQDAVDILIAHLRSPRQLPPATITVSPPKLEVIEGVVAGLDDPSGALTE